MISQSSMFVKHVANHLTMYWGYRSTAKLTGMALEQAKQFWCWIIITTYSKYVCVFFLVKRGLTCVRNAPNAFGSSMIWLSTKEMYTRRLKFNKMNQIHQQYRLQWWRMSRSPESYPKDWKNWSTFCWSMFFNSCIFLAATSNCSRMFVICLCMKEGETSSANKIFSKRVTIQDAITEKVIGVIFKVKQKRTKESANLCFALHTSCSEYRWFYGPWVISTDEAEM